MIFKVDSNKPHPDASADAIRVISESKDFLEMAQFKSRDGAVVSPPAVGFSNIEGISEDAEDQKWSDLDDEIVDDASGDVDKDNVTGDTKMVIAVRTDLKMSKGKLCAQVGHLGI